MLRVFVVLAFAKALSSCTSSSKQEAEISNIPLQVEFIKFHQEFDNLKPAELPTFQSEYPVFFPASVPDSIWLAKLQGRDTIHNLLMNAVNEADFKYDQLQDEVEDVMRHVKYYFPEFKETNVVTVLTEVDDDLNVVATPQYLIIGIDNYLGSDHELYAGISRYKTARMNPENIVPDVAMEYAQLFVPPAQGRTFLDQMIYHGKLLYLQEQFAPTTAASYRLGYSQEKYDFAVNSEEQVWRYFIDNDVLYSTDQQLQARFMAPGPFSKFYLEIDNQTPGAIARFIGYKIVSAYMDNNVIQLEDLISVPATTLFNDSKYKPAR
ncbi:gliding motility lipoprotein GldB [Nonlabens ponticola]|uniref:Gliding motility lipoprotein GldB n=2 Tax=Nonlabens ponticola TaxID=2496866 RepID=A0A3S9N151_9FLAO|nr:gliding motility lipoprotein GldB [Nonlabens ponticola]